MKLKLVALFAVLIFAQGPFCGVPPMPQPGCTAICVCEKDAYGGQHCTWIFRC